MDEYVVLIYGRPGVGKTTLASSWPSALFFSTERVSKGLSLYDFNSENGGVTDWRIVKEGIKLLKSSGHGFRTVVIDTIDEFYNKCLDWVCSKRGVQHPSDMNDYGKTWAEVRKEFASALYDIGEQGLGLVLISHAKEVEITAYSGEKFTRIQPTVTPNAWTVLKGITDLNLYCEFVRTKGGNTGRVIFTEGDEVFEAKNPFNYPRIVPMPKIQGYKLLDEGSRGASIGVDPSTIAVSKTATEGMGKSLGKELSNAKKAKRVATTRRK